MDLAECKTNGQVSERVTASHQVTSQRLVWIRLQTEGLVDGSYLGWKTESTENKNTWLFWFAAERRTPLNLKSKFRVVRPGEPFLMLRLISMSSGCSGSSWSSGSSWFLGGWESSGSLFSSSKTRLKEQPKVHSGCFPWDRIHVAVGIFPLKERLFKPDGLRLDLQFYFYLLYLIWKKACLWACRGSFSPRYYWRRDSCRFPSSVPPAFRLPPGKQKRKQNFWCRSSLTAETECRYGVAGNAGTGFRRLLLTWWRATDAPPWLRRMSTPLTQIPNHTAHFLFIYSAQLSASPLQRILWLVGGAHTHICHIVFSHMALVAGCELIRPRAEDPAAVSFVTEVCRFVYCFLVCCLNNNI